MLSSLRRVWNFSEKRQKILFRALLFSFIEGTFMMVRLYAIIIAIQTLLGECDVQTGIIGVLLAAVVCIIGTFISSYIVQTTSVEAGFGMVNYHGFAEKI